MAGEKGRGGARTTKVVTLDTSQALMSSLKVEHAASQFVQAECAQKRYDMSLTRETSHLPISPYVARAAAGLAHHKDRAVSRDARSGKRYMVPLSPGSAGGAGVYGGGGGEGGDGGDG